MVAICVDWKYPQPTWKHSQSNGVAVITWYGTNTAQLFSRLPWRDLTRTLDLAGSLVHFLCWKAFVTLLAPSRRRWNLFKWSWWTEWSSTGGVSGPALIFFPFILESHLRFIPLHSVNLKWNDKKSKPDFLSCLVDKLLKWFNETVVLQSKRPSFPDKCRYFKFRFLRKIYKKKNLSKFYEQRGRGWRERPAKPQGPNQNSSVTQSGVAAHQLRNTGLNHLFNVAH